MFDISPFLISLKSTLLATLFVFIFGIFFARLSLNLSRKASWFLDTIFTLPMVLPPTVTGFFLLVIFGRNSFLGSILKNFGISLIFSWQATVIAAMVVSFPMMYRGAKGAFKQVDQDHIWSARTLGLSEGAILIKIMIPEASPGILAATALTFARALGEFGATLMVAGNIPGRTQTIPMAIYFATAGGDMKSAWIWVGVITIVSFISLGLMSYFKKD